MPRRHVVRPGDCVASIAAQNGLSVARIWDYGENRALRGRRSSPYLLATGDEVALPDGGPAPSRVVPGSSHSYTGTPPRVRLRLELKGERFADETVTGSRDDADTSTRTEEPGARPAPEVEALASVRYKLVAGGRETEGTTDGDGVLDEAIDARITSVRLVLEAGTEHERTIEVRVGFLDPPEEESGILQRLANLGVATAGGDASMAVASFQKAAGLPVTGLLDDETRRAVVDRSGG